MRIEFQAIMPGISSDDRYIGILIQIMEAKAKTETIGKRHLVINHIALVDGVILLAHIAWHDVTAVGGYIKTDIVERSEEHTSELQSLMRISYAVFCLKKKKQKKQ